MLRYVRGGAWPLAVVLGAIVAVGLLLVGWPVGDSARAGTRLGNSQRLDRGDWLRRLPPGRPGVALEIRLDELLDQASTDGHVVIDHEAYVQLVRRIVGDDTAEDITVGELLDLAPRVRVTYRGESIQLDRPQLLRYAERLIGGVEAIENVRLGTLLDLLPQVELRSGDMPESFDDTAISGVLDRVLGTVQRVERPTDPGFEERQALIRRYEAVGELLDELRIAGFGSIDDPDALYDEAFRRLLDQGRLDDVPLLEGQQRLEQQYAQADLSAMSHAERIAYRWDARRAAFGPELAETLFGRREAVERYEIDRLAIEADPGLDAAGRAARLEERRAALKVERSGQGGYVGFAGADRAEVEAIARERHGAEFDAMSQAERDEAIRQIYLERLPGDLRDYAEGRRGRRP